MHLWENFLCDIEPYLGLENVKCRSPFGCNKRSFSKVISVSSYLSIFAFQLKVIVLFTYTHFSHNWYIFIHEKIVFGLNQYFLISRERREAEQRLERDRVEKERIEKERMDRERRERERREERDRMEREQRREQERRERERKDQLSKVDEHFKLSMEYHNKVRPDWNYLWSSFINLWVSRLL